MNPKIFLSSPHISQASQDYVQEAFDQNWVAPLGPNVNAFEESIQDYLNEDLYVAALSSGTAALHLALELLGVERDDEVICQSFTFAASANPIIYVGATPIFVDSEEHTWNISPRFLEIAIKDRIAKGKKPKAIILVHLYGMPCRIDEIQAIAQKFGIPIVEDSAEALGSSFQGKKCGSFGEISILSFNGNKIITTSGGGALVSQSKKIRDRAIFLATQARDDAAHYEHSTIGYNYRLSNICAGIGRGQMEVLDERVAARRGMHSFYEAIFKNIVGVTVFTEPSQDYFSNHWLTAILVDPTETNGITREGLRHALELDQIESRPLWKPMHLQPVFKDYPYYGEGCCDRLFEIGLCLPSGSNLSADDLKRIELRINRTFT